MESITKWRADLKTAVSKNLATGLQQIGRSLSNPDNNEYFLLTTRVEKYLKSSRQNRLDYKQDDLTHTTLANSIFEFLDSLVEADISRSSAFREAIFVSILAVCPDPNAETEMRKFFNERYFRNVAYLPSESEKVADKKFDIVVFYALHLNKMEKEEADKQRILLDGLIQAQLDNGAFVLYLGKFTSLLDKYPMKVYAANSPISLYGRIREMVEFLHYYKETI